MDQPASKATARTARAGIEMDFAGKHGACPQATAHLLLCGIAQCHIPLTAGLSPLREAVLRDPRVIKG